ncbi:hypothetical protein RJ641_012242 [Dillenia turbinata]|uniref:Adenylate isopentenyltransferase n=1 Tax=Dillenia turbinata TaxID=194707 RepID=A0AAN8Z3R1_9MAGN
MKLSFLSFSFPFRTAYAHDINPFFLSPSMANTILRRHNHHHRHKPHKLIVIMGATGTGKSKLSINLGRRFPSEIINSDKIQVYKGLDITTNKISMSERLGIPHHLLGFHTVGEFTPSDFRSLATSTIADITSRRKLPILVGGSNSFIYSLLTTQFNPKSDVFSGSDPVSLDLRYNCILLWVDVSLPVLCEYLSKRVDDMLDVGMFEELADFYDPGKESDPGRVGLRMAIGVPEFDKYFQRFPPGDGENGNEEEEKREEYMKAVKSIKDNTCELAKRQIEKIQRLRSAGWELRRLDATEAFRAVLESESEKGRRIWEREVAEKSVKIVKRFLEE